MAYRIPSGKWRGQVAWEGKTHTKCFGLKRDALDWEVSYRAELERLAQEEAESAITLRAACERYALEVSPKKRSGRWEIVRLTAMMRDTRLPMCQPMHKVLPADIALWRDARLLEVTAGSLIREMCILRSVFEVARLEWGMLKTNPVKDVRKPKVPAPRDVVISWPMVRAMLRALGYSHRRRVSSMRQSVAQAFLLALRTGMRQGELCRLTWDNVNVAGQYARLPVTKTVPRDVPLTRKAIRIIERMRGFDDETVFGTTPQAFDSLFRKYRVRAGLSGFTFHDTRHTAATWLAGRMQSSGIPPQQALLDFCRIFGWSNVSQALTYFNPSVLDLARRMEGTGPR